MTQNKIAAQGPGFCLQSKSFTISASAGDQQTQSGWYEFEATVNGETIRLGGATLGQFFKEFRDSAENERGRAVSTISHARFRDLLSDGSVQHLGHVAFSGYNTIYLFKENVLFHLVVADAQGNLLAHSKVLPEVIDTWKSLLRRI